MAKGDRSTRVRAPRSDALRNRGVLIEAAKRVFAERGAAVTLDQVAAEAGVGIGTLYRHFPTRDALIEAVYQQETDDLVSAAAALLASGRADDALRAWLLLFIDFLETKQDLGAVIDTLIGGSEPMYSETPARLAPAVELLVGRLADSGMALDIAPLDLLRAIAGIATIRPANDWKPRAVDFMQLLLRGVRHAASPPR